MARKYAVLRQFTTDFDRLLSEAEGAFARLRAFAPDGSGQVGQVEIAAVFRPVHSLKGICGMLDETKLLVPAFHRFEEVLPPLLPVRAPRILKENSGNWVQLGEATFRMAREVEQILRAKIELWRKLGADENETQGLVLEFQHEGVTLQTWTAITSLVGLIPASFAGKNVVSDDLLSVGRARGEGEALLVEVADGTVTVYFEEILSTCTRAQAVQAGYAPSFKEWWLSTRKSTGRKVA